MSTKNNIKNLIDNFGEIGSTSFAAFLAKAFEDKIIELYFGEDFEKINTEQCQTGTPSVICGTILNAVNNFIILDCYSNNNDHLQAGSVVFINMDKVIAIKEFNKNRPLSNIFIKSSIKTHGKIGS